MNTATVRSLAKVAADELDNLTAHMDEQGKQNTAEYVGWLLNSIRTEMLVQTNTHSAHPVEVLDTLIEKFHQYKSAPAD